MSAAPPLDAIDDMARVVDLRLADTWAMLFERGDLDEDFVAWLLRLAYVSGYWDALSEPDRGALCTELGYPVPEREGDDA